jgi:hypothetical protein
MRHKLHRGLIAACAAFFIASVASPQAPAQSGEAPDVLRSDETKQAQAHRFSADDEKFLDEVERGCFQYLWNEIGSPSGFVKDRTSAAVASLAGVGFQLSALTIGVERGWITRDEGEKRARQVLRSLRRRDDNRREGIYLHFVEANSGDLYRPFKNEASTVDHALLLAGAMPAATYFGGEVAKLVGDIAGESNWRAFISPVNGYLSMAWQPADNVNMKGDGKLMENSWRVASDEERIIYFLAVGCPTSEFALEPRDYYKLHRESRKHGDDPPFIASNTGTPFTYFFSHCWIDYRGLDADNPAEFGIEAPRVDWFENSRRAILVHRKRCLEAADRFASFGQERWGVSPCMGFDDRGRMTYMVQDVLPNLFEHEEWQHGTIAPYAAGSSIMFTPAESLAALRAFRQLKDDNGKPLVWRDPAAGGYALADSFNLDQKRACDDNVAIDVGPMLLAIENARTRLIWRLFMQHEVAKRAVERLKLAPLHENHPDPSP